MGKRIFVRNLSFGSTDEALRAHFENAGHQVRSARIVLDRETGKSRGFGFVELMSDERFDEATASLDGSFLDGRPISVREAHDQRQGGGPPRPHDQRQGGGLPRRGPGGPGGPDGGFPPRREGGGGRDFGPPRREGGGFGGPPRGEPGGFGGGPGFMPPDQQPTERRRPPQKKKKVYRAEEDDRSSMREAEERRGRKQRRRMRGGFDGGFDDEW